MRETPPVDVGQTESQERLSGTEVNTTPYANSHSLQNAFPMMPGGCWTPPALCT